VIQSFRHKALKKLFAGQPKGIEASLRRRVEEILFLLESATSAESLALPGLQLHELKGDQQGVWSVAVNKNWRITFRFEGSNASEVDLVDYH
jgi:proteic killer suppression protein